MSNVDKYCCGGHGNSSAAMRAPVEDIDALATAGGVGI